MATNLTREDKFFQKKPVCVAAAILEVGDNILSTTDTYKLFNLPADALIIGADIFTLTQSDAATSASGVLGTTDGGNEIMTATDLKTAAGTHAGNFVGNINTGTGAGVYFGQTITGASTVGKYLVMVEYVEYNLATGMYTRFD